MVQCQPCPPEGNCRRLGPAGASLSAASLARLSSLAFLGLQSCHEPPAQGGLCWHAHTESVAQGALTPPPSAHTPGAHRPGARGAASGVERHHARSTGPTAGTAPRGSRPARQGSPASCRAGNRRRGPSMCGPHWLGWRRKQRGLPMGCHQEEAST